jgi:asparagine synthase (glutamine-hydrolysing)
LCGLFGFVAEAGQVGSNLETARTARDTLTHRGPDQSGEWHDARVYVGHRRLSIIDTSEAGRQPMVSTDGAIVISVNGEIYNFQALRADLEAAGAVFHSGSDSEVVLHGYRQWGIEALLDKIDGMYAFSVYDAPKGLLYLARDRIGIKPLYYGQVGGMVSWASELKALVAFHGKNSLPLDKTALYDFLTYRYIPSPKSCYTNIRKLPPGHLLRLDLASGQLDVRRYWELPFGEDPIDEGEAAEQLHHLLSQSVAEQMVADVPVGFFLSGGIDSSAVTAHARALGHEANTFCIGFGDKAFDETPYAELVASHLGTRHQTDIITPKLDVSFPEWLLSLYDEPFADNSALPTWYVAQSARRAATVVLTGDGGDELFGGYRWYRTMPLVQRAQWLLSRIPKSTAQRYSRGMVRKALTATCGEPDLLAIMNTLYMTPSSPQLRAHYRSTFGIPSDYADMWFFHQYWKPDQMPLRKALQYVDFHTFLPDDVLTKVDRATMAHSLEARVPFLSRALAEFAFRLPEKFLYRGNRLKGGLKMSCGDMLPGAIHKRPKKGFSLPWARWHQELGSEKSLVASVLNTFVEKAA